MAMYSEVTPKLRIAGAGFGIGQEDEIALSFDPPMDPSAYKLFVTSDKVMSLHLAPEHAWPMKEGEALTSLLLTSYRIGGVEDLDHSVEVAKVIETPAIMNGGDKVIYETGTKIFNINGTGFRAKSTMLIFNPPLEKEEDYMLTVRSPTFMQLTLKTGKKWREDPGPLKVSHIDTGAGWLRIDSKYGGVTVAEVQVDLGLHGVTVDSSDTTRIYQSQSTLKIFGTGFNSVYSANSLIWGNSLRGKGVNYTITGGTSDELTLTLVPGANKWRANPVNLPGPLTLLAVDAGAGLIPVGPTEAKKGRVVATVFADPTVQSNPSKKIYVTHTHEMWISGTNFVPGSTIFAFDPPLDVGIDYVSSTVNSTSALVSLKDGKRWSPVAGGNLRVTAIDTGAGFVRGFTPVIVAAVVADADDHPSGITVDRSSGREIYSENPKTGEKQSVIISGSGFCENPVLSFSPEVDPSIYEISKSSSDTSLVLDLQDGERWRDWPGTLVLNSMTCPQATVDFANGDGIAVATILDLPVVSEELRRVYVTHTKRLIISGSGLSHSALGSGVEVSLDPTPSEAFEVVDVRATEIVLALVDGYSWLPADEFPTGNETKPIYALSIDTGAGSIKFGDFGVKVAEVFADPAGAICDDSCQYSLDGVCDDGSGSGNGYLTGDGASLLDDDFGGFYGFDDDTYGHMGTYYYVDDDIFAGGHAVCDLGTDCTDCSGFVGPDEVVGPQPPVECDNSCQWANDDQCDDTRTTGFCDLGTDCHDCGPTSQGNFTLWSDDDWWDDDGMYFTDDEYDGYYAAFRDDDAASAPMVHSIPNPRTKMSDLNDEAGAGGIFMLVLEGIVLIIGILLFTMGSWFSYRYIKGEKVGFQLLPTDDLDSKSRLGSSRSATELVPITPDVAYSSDPSSRTASSV